MTLAKVLEILVWILAYIERQMILEAERKQSGKLDALQASIDELKKARTPEDRKRAALAIEAARKQ